MKKLLLATGLVTFGFSGAALAEGTYMPKYVEDGLISVCKAAAQDKSMRMSKEIKGLRLKTKTVALNVVCNGEDIISFAENYGAEKTAAKLSNSIGSVQVTDIAMNSSTKFDVTFDMEN